MFISPMLLEKCEEAFNHQEYFFEPKVDGHRLILSSMNNKVRLYTRHNNEVTERYPELHNVPFSGDAILDGELVCLDPATNQFCFELTMERFQTTRPESIKSMTKRLPVVFVVFDILMLHGKDLRRLPLYERKSLLGSLFQDNLTFIKNLCVDTHGIPLFETIKANKMEGIVAKRKQSTYVSKRSDDWLKIINWSYDTVLLSGYRKGEFGWLASKIVNGETRHMGIIEHGVSTSQKQSFRNDTKPFITKETDNFVYVEPNIKAKVKFRNLTRKGLLRSPTFVDFVS